eukprot:COSAG02_NODE_4073_length_5830_cov_3.915373_5_plen_346_part_00
MIFANGSMNFLGGRSRRAIHKAYDAMTRKEEPVGFLREFSLGISHLPPSPRSSTSSNVAAMMARTTSSAAVPQAALTKEQVVDQAITAAEDAVDDGDEDEAKTLSTGVRKKIRQDLLKCFADGDDDGDEKPWPLIEAKLRAYVTEKKKTLKSTEMAAVLAGSLKRLLPRRDDDAAERLAAAKAAADLAAANAAADLADAKKAEQARARATPAAAATTAAAATADAPPPSPAVGAGHGDLSLPGGGGGVKRKADDAQLDSVAESNSAGARAATGGISSSAAATGGSATQGAGRLNGKSEENKPQAIQLGAGKAVKFGLGRAMRGGGASKKRTRGKAFGFAAADDND